MRPEGCKFKCSLGNSWRPMTQDEKKRKAVAQRQRACLPGRGAWVPCAALKNNKGNTRSQWQDTTPFRVAWSPQGDGFTELSPQRRTVGAECLIPPLQQSQFNRRAYRRRGSEGAWLREGSAQGRCGWRLLGSGRSGRQWGGWES